MAKEGRQVTWYKSPLPLRSKRWMRDGPRVIDGRYTPR